MERRDFLRNGILLGTAGLIPSLNHTNQEPQEIGCTVDPCADAIDVRLHQAARNGDIKTMAALLDSGADIHTCDENWATPLFHAVWSRKPEAVKFLLETKTDVCIVDVMDCRSRPLHWAAWFGDIRIMEMLFDHHSYTGDWAYVDQQDRDERTALYSAIGGGKLEAVKFLVGKGTDVNHRDSQGLSPLHVASELDKIEIMRLLLVNGADLEARLGKSTKLCDPSPPEGSTPLFCAAGVYFEGDFYCQNNSLDAMKFLLDRGVNVNARDYEGCTLLHRLAMCYNHHCQFDKNETKILDKMSLLIASGADIEIGNYANRETALDYAKYVNIPEMLELLQNAAAASTAAFSRSSNESRKSVSEERQRFSPQEQ